jgi:hypothetical protein
MDPLSLGRKFYGRKDYEGALKAFTEESSHDLSELAAYATLSMNVLEDIRAHLFYLGH